MAKPIWLEENKPPNVFSHSARCDEYFSESAMLNVDPVIWPNGSEHYQLLSGGEVPHTECMCWCHNVAIDKNEPPEYIREQDAENFEFV